MSVTRITSSPKPARVGDSVTLKATVRGLCNSAGSSLGVPTGTVTFFDGTKLLGAGTADGNGGWTLTTSSLTAGRHLITAKYEPDAGSNFLGSRSSVFVQTILSATVPTIPKRPAAGVPSTPRPGGTIAGQVLHNVLAGLSVGVRRWR